MVDYIALGVLGLQSVLLGVALVLARKSGGLTRRQRIRDELASRAVLYAQQMGGSNSEKLTHALAAFKALDLADNGKRDYADVEARIAIEARLNQFKR